MAEEMATKKNNSSADFVDEEVSDTDVGSFSPSSPVGDRNQRYGRRKKGSREQGRQQQYSGGSRRKFFGGFGELNQEVKLHRKIWASITKDGKCQTLDILAKEGSLSREKTVKESKIQFDARKISIRQTASVALFMLIFYFVLGVTIVVRVGGQTIQNAIFYLVYTMTSTGFGTVEMPLEGYFPTFLIFLMFYGVGCITLVASQVYLFISLESSNMKLQLEKKKNQRGDISKRGCCGVVMHILGDITDFCFSSSTKFATLFRESEWVRFAAVLGYLLSLLLVGTFAMMAFEGWSFVQGMYFSSFCMTTMGYGDMTPVTRGGIWFVIAWLPLNVTFVCIYMGNMARYYRSVTSWYTDRVYKNMLASKKTFTSDSLLAHGNEINGLKIPYSTDKPTLCSMRDVLQLVLENLALADEEISDKSLRNKLQLLSPWEKTGPFFSNLRRKPSLALLVLVQERLIIILSREIKNFSNIDVVENHDMFRFTIKNFDDVARKWKIPEGCNNAFSLVVFEALAYLGEKGCVMKSDEAFLSLSPFECHHLFTPFLAALEDAGTMEGWLASTEELVGSYASITTFAMNVSKQKVAELSGSDHQRVSSLDESGKKRLTLSQGVDHGDLVMLAKLSNAYSSSLEEKQILYLSKFRANRIIALSALYFFLLYEVFATVFVMKTGNVPLNEAILFTMYTITSAGFGSVKVPDTTGFTVFSIFNIFISISGIAILIAQVFASIELFSHIKEHTKEKIRMAENGKRTLARLNQDVDSPEMTVRDAMRIELSKSLRLVGNLSRTEEETVGAKMKKFLLGTDPGRALCTVSILIFLLLIGAMVTMLTEGWTFLDALYFSTYAMLTVGHGDLVPSTNAGIWFVNFWLAFNVLFVTLFLGSVAYLIANISNRNVARIEKNLRVKYNLAAVETSTHEAVSGRQFIRNEEKLAKCLRTTPNSVRVELVSDRLTMGDLLKKLHEPTTSSTSNSETVVVGSSTTLPMICRELLCDKNTGEIFKLRLLVLDRVARITSAFLVDFNGLFEIKVGTIQLTVESLEDWISEWKIPRRARKAYRTIIFECMLLVGEKELVERGVAALFDLSILEFVELFSAFVFLLEDNESMEEWLAATADKANDTLSTELGDDNCNQLDYSSVTIRDRRRPKNTIENYFLCNPGNAVRLKL